MYPSDLKVLFVNHKQDHCGVYQYFTKLVHPVTESRDNWFYIETNEEWEHDHWIVSLEPDIVVYNFYFSGATMPWLTDNKIARQKTRFKQLGIHHEGNMDSKGFDLILHQDPSNTDTRYFNLPRPIPEYHNIQRARNIIPHIGSFGFGLGGKGFTRVVEQVVKEFDEAVIRINIPFAFFGDANGDGARSWATACKTIADRKQGIELYITHDLLPENQLLDFIAVNDVNCFFYDDNIGRGISGTLDYALAVRKPIAITHSDQFRHMWDDNILIEKNTLRAIIQKGTDHLEPYYKKWNKEAMIVAFEQAFKQVMGE